MKRFVSSVLEASLCFGARDARFVQGGRVSWSQDEAVSGECVKQGGMRKVKAECGEFGEVEQEEMREIREIRCGMGGD